MPIVPSPEIAAIARRVLATWDRGDVSTMANLFHAGSDLRVIGFDADERWNGSDEFLRVLEAQIGEMPNWSLQPYEVEAFEDGSFGWAILRSKIVTPEAESEIRHSAVFQLIAGAWRVVLWHNSIPVPNQQVFGVDLTTTLGDLVTNVLGASPDLAGSAGSEGTATLVFTDIVDSTALAQSVGDVGWAELVGTHERAIRRIAETCSGTVVKFLGDGSMLAFESARAAVRAAIEIQRAVRNEPFDVRIGVHTGEVIRTKDDLLGLTVNKAARVAAAAGGASIMVSSTTRELVGEVEGMEIGAPRIVVLKGIADAHQIFPVNWD
jgi:uncharacterized protein (TIGR02246 family)